MGVDEQFYTKNTDSMGLDSRVHAPYAPGSLGMPRNKAHPTLEDLAVQRGRQRSTGAHG